MRILLTIKISIKCNSSPLPVLDLSLVRAKSSRFYCRRLRSLVLHIEPEHLPLRSEQNAPRRIRFMIMPLNTSPSVTLHDAEPRIYILMMRTLQTHDTPLRKKITPTTCRQGVLNSGLSCERCGDQCQCCIRDQQQTVFSFAPSFDRNLATAAESSANGTSPPLSESNILQSSQPTSQLVSTSSLRIFFDLIPRSRLHMAPQNIHYHNPFLTHSLFDCLCPCIQHRSGRLMGNSSST